MADDINGQRHDRRALVLYGSETGNSQDVAEELGRMAERLHFVTRVSEMDLLEIVCLFMSWARMNHNAHSCMIEDPLKVHSCYFCNCDNWTRRVPEECKEILEESLEEAFAPRLPWSRVLHDLWSWGQFLPKVWVILAIRIGTFADCGRFNWSARKLHKRLEQLGAKEVYPRGEADEQHQEG
jgi:hypothetical protein